MANRWLHRSSILVAVSTLFLVFVGALVTSTDSGLSVPDWPLSYGRFMPPMVGGIFYEHGHRMVAATVGFFTLLLAVLFMWKENRLWVKRTAWAALGLVILQGVLGGITVLFRLPKPVSILHACLAQSFFCLITALVVWTSKFWNRDTELRTEPASTLPLHRISFVLFVACYLQLIVGAVLRHTGFGFMIHIVGALVILGIGSYLYKKSQGQLRRFSAGVVSVVVTQILFGLSTYVILGHRFDVIPRPMAATMVVSAHVALGAFLLALVLVTALVAYRTRPLDTPPLKTTLSDYFELTKPGISFMAGATALAGFVLGADGKIDWFRLFHTCIGTLMVAGAAGSLNMLLEIHVDARMRRTQRRPLPSGRLKPGEALFLGTLLAVGGITYLGWAVNLLTAFLAGVTLSVYLYIYTPLKKVTGVCVSVGAVAGALPPVMGWTAATGRLGWEPLALFSILFFWQFPHFLSLAWLYKDDYEGAGLRMLPDVSVEGGATARSVLATSFILVIVSCLPTLLDLTGMIYLIGAVSLSAWLAAASFMFYVDRSKMRARQLFLASILYMPLLVAFMVLNRLPFLF